MDTLFSGRQIDSEKKYNDKVQGTRPRNRTNTRETAPAQGF